MIERTIFAVLNQARNRYSIMDLPLLNNLLIIAGTGRKSGKTTIACSIIKAFCDIGPVTIKISPHFHQTSEDLISISKNKKYNIFLERSLSGEKDSSRMLVSGAKEAYFIQANDNNVHEAFMVLNKQIRKNTPILCESPALRKYISPGAFIIADNKDNKDNKHKKDLGLLYDLADYLYEFHDDETDLINRLSFSFGRWFFS